MDKQWTGSMFMILGMILVIWSLSKINKNK
jgi:hypothetical protein